MLPGALNFIWVDECILTNSHQMWVFGPLPQDFVSSFSDQFRGSFLLADDFVLF